MKEVFDVIVIGGGAIGAATLHFSAKLGLTKTLLLEQRSDFARGATGAWGSLLRQFGAIPFYADNSSASLRYYLEEFTEDTGFELEFTKTGALYFLNRDQVPLLKEKREKIESNRGFPLEVLIATEGRIRFPEFHWFDDDIAVYESNAGTLCPDQVVNSWIDSARKQGAQAEKNVRIVEFLTTDNKITGVRCDQGNTYLCKQVVLATGPWTQSVLETMGIHLPLVCRPLQINRFRYETQTPENEIPFFIDGTADTFGRPMPNGEFLGGHILDETASPAMFRQPLSLHHAADAKRHLAKRLKHLRTSSLVGGIRALESYSVSKDPIMCFTEKYRNLFVAAGWCCTGFALAPVLGKHIARSVSETAGKLK